MLALRKKLQKGQGQSNSPTSVNGKRGATTDTRVSVRDKLLVKEVQEMEQNLVRPISSVVFEDPDQLYRFTLVVCPEEGYWCNGKFKFNIDVPEEYNIVPPKVVCTTKIWHPNISEDGEVCLSLLRENSLDSHGWAPTRRLKDVVWGLSSLFTDLLNFEDPLNVQAADHYEHDKESFIAKVHNYIDRFARR